MKMLENFLCCLKLETGGLVFGILTLILSIVEAVLSYEMIMYDVHSIPHSFVIGVFADATPEHILRIIYLVLGICDILTSLLLIVGVTLKNKHMLLPWMLNFVLSILITLAEYFVPIFACAIITSGLGFVFYIWYCILCLYYKFDSKEVPSTGVQMAYVDESSTAAALPAYSIFTNEKQLD